ncbi:helix-turn-helix domain-containing protein [Ruminiclostridium josui]|uniref:helix-turn-helix domain-containing protein n=1 Tax=Ruminiclostridium josui TaxID=1499 RepID=UPI000464B11A|nr:helix-turn-helix transcriptional regulator [Ruminiclostridium josui]
MNIDYKMLGVRIKNARENKCLTQEQLAEITGLSNNYISNIERNHSIPSLETLVKICNALDVTPDFLLVDSVFTYSSREYINDNIARLLAKCNDKNVRLISKFIELLISEQEPK